MPVTIHFYDKHEPYYEFTNFAAYPIELDGKLWPTSEHYYQAQKHVGTELVETIRLATTPREAFNLGRSQTARADWQTAREQAMYRAVKAKFSQHRQLCELLLSTSDAVLVEHTVNDCYWGDGGDGCGQNMLGQILMQVRAELRAVHAL